MRLLIEDGYTSRVGFKAVKGRAAVEFDLRPFAGADGVRQYNRVILAEDATALVVADMLGDGSDAKPARISSWSFPFDCSEKNLLKLRSPEFSVLMLALYDQVVPDYEVIGGKQVPYALSEEREGN